MHHGNSLNVLSFSVFFGCRYQLLPYLYTCFYHVNQQGGTVARPLFFEWPADSMSIDHASTQWLLGPGIMVAPVLQPGQDHVMVYFPKATWYSMWDYQRVIGEEAAFPAHNSGKSNVRDVCCGSIGRGSMAHHDAISAHSQQLSFWSLSVITQKSTAQCQHPSLPVP